MVVTTPANAPLLSLLLAAHPASVQPLALPFPGHPSLPPGLENVKNCPPSYFAIFIHALAALHQPILAWAKSQSAAAQPVVAVLSDFFCGWTQPLAAELGVPRLVFSPSGVLGTAVPHSLFRRLVKRPSEADDGYVVMFPAIPGELSYQWREISGTYINYIEGRMEELVGAAVRQNFLWNLESWGFVSNTLRALEGRYLDAPLQDLGFKRVWAVDPLAPETHASGKLGGDLGAWLDGFSEGTVVYVCFGSQALLTPAVAAALGEALERSAVPFVWAVGAGDGVVLPEGFEARASAAKRGLVVRGWAPQVAILRHAAVGWFMTHCGWNSMLEAVAAGVPMLAYPMAADQFVNARLLVDEARVAVRACAGGLGVAPDAGFGGVGGRDSEALNPRGGSSVFVLSFVIGEFSRGTLKNAVFSTANSWQPIHVHLYAEKIIIT
uniref:Uncharacterized protein n=1 Tax=Avena sativa TaxID=4498 RepID=A0ACD5UFP2_AVESA